MNTFNEWWQKEEDLMRQQGANDEMVLRAMRSIAEMAWSAAQPQWQPIETAPESGPFLVYGGKIGDELTSPTRNIEAVKVDGRSSGNDLYHKKSDIVFDVADTVYYAVWVINPTHWMPLPEAPQGE